MKLQLEQINL